ncbi:MAG: cysteine desulfurase family protein [Bacilli bacterium]
MIYLDYSATTKADLRVLEYFNLASVKYFANANSIYKLGRISKGAIKRASNQILDILGFEDHEIIYTSCATEANNLAIKGVIESLKGKKNRIITNLFEHSSVIAPINVLQRKGFIVNNVRFDENGCVDLNHLKELMGPDVALVSIGSVNSEIGIRQPVEDIAQIVHQGEALFHCDATQSVGKEVLPFCVADLVTFSAHKFYGIKGIGALVKRKGVSLTAQLHGGSSTTVYRAGTPNTPLILSLRKALYLAYQNHARKYVKVKLLNIYLRGLLNRIPSIVINSPKEGLPHILNFSYLGHSSRKIISNLSRHDIYISNHSACASETKKSLAVLALTNSNQRASSSLRVSLSHLTTKNELQRFVLELKKADKNL